MGTSPTIHLWTIRERNDVAVQRCRWKFSHEETLQQTFVDRSWNLLEKVAKLRFVPPFGAVRGNVHGSSMARWKAHGRPTISGNWTFFASSYGRGAVSKYWSKLHCLKGRWVTLSANFRGKGGSSTNEFWRQKTRFPGLSRGVICVILCLAVLIQYRRVTHRHTHTHGHAIMAITRAELGSARVKTKWNKSDDHPITQYLIVRVHSILKLAKIYL